MCELAATAQWNAATLQAAVNARGPWFHSYAFTNGVRTPGRDPSAEKLAALNLPDLRGKSVLDVGAFDGYFSFQAERLGAARVVASDSIVWDTEPHSRENLRFVHGVIGSSVEEKQVRVEELAADEMGIFDVVLFLGVLYHAPNMVQYLNRVRRVARELVIIETLVDALDDERPIARLYSAGSVNDDPSTWWGPNIACVEELLVRCDFARVEFKGLWHRNTLAALRGEAPDGPLTSGRAVWHAYV